MNKYVLGVDGGGTKTQCALFDIEGNRIVLVNWGATNHETLKGGFAELEEQLRALLGHILEKNRLNQCNLA
jgi:N-acetylglucosamine kinase-like BadF-type ATPase